MEILRLYRQLVAIPHFYTRASHAHLGEVNAFVKSVAKAIESIPLLIAQSPAACSGRNFPQNRDYPNISAARTGAQMILNQTESPSQELLLGLLVLGALAEDEAIVQLALPKIRKVPTPIAQWVFEIAQPTMCAQIIGGLKTDNPFLTPLMPDEKNDAVFSLVYKLGTPDAVNGLLRMALSADTPSASALLVLPLPSIPIAQDVRPLLTQQTATDYSVSNKDFAQALHVFAYHGRTFHSDPEVNRQWTQRFIGWMLSQVSGRPRLIAQRAARLLESIILSDERFSLPDKGAQQLAALRELVSTSPRAHALASFLFALDPSSPPPTHIPSRLPNSILAQVLAHAPRRAQPMHIAKMSYRQVEQLLNAARVRGQPLHRSSLAAVLYQFAKSNAVPPVWDIPPDELLAAIPWSHLHYKAASALLALACARYPETTRQLALALAPRVRAEHAQRVSEWLYLFLSELSQTPEKLATVELLSPFPRPSWLTDEANAPESNLIKSLVALKRHRSYYDKDSICVQTPEEELALVRELSRTDFYADTPRAIIKRFDALAHSLRHVFSLSNSVRARLIADMPLEMLIAFAHADVLTKLMHGLTSSDAKRLDTDDPVRKLILAAFAPDELRTALGAFAPLSALPQHLTIKSPKQAVIALSYAGLSAFPLVKEGLSRVAGTRNPALIRAALDVNPLALYIATPKDTLHEVIPLCTLWDMTCITAMGLEDDQHGLDERAVHALNKLHPEVRDALAHALAVWFAPHGRSIRPVLIPPQSLPHTQG